MLAVMAGLLCLFFVWQFAVKPAVDMRADAQRTQAAAMRDYNIVRAGAPALGSAAGKPSGTAAFDRSAIVTTAEREGLPISRLQNETGGAVKVWFEDLPSGQIYAFLNRVTKDYAVSVTGVQISRRADGEVSAQITLRGL